MTTASKLERVLAHVEATEAADGVFVVSARGPIGGGVAGELRDVLVPVAAADRSTVVLDLVDAECLDEEAVAVVSVAAHLVRDRGARLRVATGSGAVVDPLRTWGLDELIAFHATVDEAIAGA